MHPARLIGIAVATTLLLCGSARAQMATAAPHVFLLDYDTGEVLYDKAGDAPMAPSSMAKLMTTEIVFRRLKEGSLRLSDMFHVSEKAWRQGADSSESKMFVMVGGDISVEDLLRGIIVQSGNDACVVVAEALAGSEEAFAELMTRRAKELGLTQSHFTNSTGMPDVKEYMSARDLAMLSAHVIRHYPEYYPYFAEPDFTWSGIRQPNRNPLLSMRIGADGLKTGHTAAGGYGLAASAEQNGHRLILVINGLSSEHQRAEEARRLFDVGFRDFKRYDLFKANDVVGRARVWGGEAPTVALRVGAPLSATIHREGRRDMKVRVRYQSPLPAPIAAGEQVGTLSVSAPNKPEKTVPLYAATAVSRPGIFGRVWLGFAALIGAEGS